MGGGASITMKLIQEIIDSKQGKRIDQTIKTLPLSSVIVLDSLCNVFDQIGQEKESSAEKLYLEVQRVCHSGGFEKINQKEFMSSLEQLIQYSFVDTLKKSKQDKRVCAKNPAILLKVELKELI